MKRTISAILLGATMLAFCACGAPEATTQPNTTAPAAVPVVSEEFVPLLEGNSRNGPFDNHTPTFDVKQIDVFKTRSDSTKTAAQVGEMTKTVSVFGREVEVEYRQTWNANAKQYDMYVALLDISVHYDCETGKPVKYQLAEKAVNRQYSSPVNPNSSEDEFVAYAREVLTEFSGKSTEGLTATVQTQLNGNIFELLNRFENFPEEHEIPSKNACYVISFQKEICGIFSYEEMTVTMTNVGEIISIDAIADLDKFQPFENIAIDIEHLDEVILDNAPTKSGANNRYITSKALFVQDDVLWMRCMVESTWTSQGVLFRGGNWYFVKLAELQPLTAEN